MYGTAGGTADIGRLVLQVGANEGDQIAFDVSSFVFSVMASAAKIAGTAYNGAAQNLLLSTASGAASVISAMDTLIAKVDAQRADLGAIQNRLESSIRNQSNISLNEADARSRIRDTNFAEEAANLSQQTIIQQAATSMLMQANTRPQLALSMLG